MRKTKYSIIFLNDIEMDKYADGFTEAVILAMAWAIENGRDTRIKYITDEKGTTIKNIQYPKFEFSK